MLNIFKKRTRAIKPEIKTGTWYKRKNNCGINFLVTGLGGSMISDQRHIILLNYYNWEEIGMLENEFRGNYELITAF